MGSPEVEGFKRPNEMNLQELLDDLTNHCGYIGVNVYELADNLDKYYKESEIVRVDVDRIRKIKERRPEQMHKIDRKLEKKWLEEKTPEMTKILDKLKELREKKARTISQNEQQQIEKEISKAEWERNHINKLMDELKGKLYLLRKI